MMHTSKDVASRNALITETPGPGESMAFRPVTPMLSFRFFICFEKVVMV